MSKEALKTSIRSTQNGLCELTGEFLPAIPALYDTDRRKPKAKGGIYLPDNTRVVTPRAHMERHGILRERAETFEQLKTSIDIRRHMMNLKNKINNQFLAAKRGVDHLDETTDEFLTYHLSAVEKRLTEQGRMVEKLVKKLAKVDPLAKSALGVKSIGPITVAYCMTYIYLEKSRHASSLWAYVGLDKPSHSRYEKGTAGGGNKTLRTVLYTMADSQIKGRGPYREVYNNVKHRLSLSERMIKTYNTQGHLVEMAWKDTKPSHRHGAALRAIMKHFLADYWFVGRTLAGLPTDALYVEAMLEGNHRKIQPEERGWKY